MTWFADALRMHPEPALFFTLALGDPGDASSFQPGILYSVFD